MLKRRHDPRHVAIIAAVLLILLLGGFSERSKASASIEPGWQPSWSQVLFSGLPGLTQVKTSPVSDMPTVKTRNLLHALVYYLTDVDLTEAKSVLQQQIAGLIQVPSKGAKAAMQPAPPSPKPAVLPRLNLGRAVGKVLVGIYHTHTSEDFVPDSGVSHQRGGSRGGIVALGLAMAERLQSHGIGVVHSTAIHDSPSFMKAYGASELTVKKMLAENPDLQMLIDIHRDAEERKNITADIGGKSSARILMIVAQGQDDLPQPHWQENYAFAQLIHAKLEERFPGLSRGVQLVDWRYNQHLHPRAILLEVGSHESTKQEVVNAAEMFADCIAEIFSESSG